MCRGRYINIFHPTLDLNLLRRSYNTINHHNRCGSPNHHHHLHNQHSALFNTLLHLPLRIHLLNRLVLLPRLPRWRLLYERPHLRNRRLLSR
jgi:hypothetical protein